MSECAGYRRVGEAILNEHGIEPGATADELPAPEAFDGVRELLAVARVCPVVLRTPDGRGDETNAFAEHGWSGQSRKWGLVAAGARGRQSLQRLTERELAPLAGYLKRSPQRLRWVSVKTSEFFKAHQHPEVDR